MAMEGSDGAVGDPAKAAVGRARQDLILRIESEIRRWKVSGPKAAVRLRIDETEVRSLLAGEVEAADLDMLMELAHRAGLDPRIETVASWQRKGRRTAED